MASVYLFFAIIHATASSVVDLRQQKKPMENVDSRTAPAPTRVAAPGGYPQDCSRIPAAGQFRRMADAERG
jgi:hypothetical protein